MSTAVRAVAKVGTETTRTCVRPASAASETRRVSKASAAPAKRTCDEDEDEDGEVDDDEDDDHE